MNKPSRDAPVPLPTMQESLYLVFEGILAISNKQEEIQNDQSEIKDRIDWIADRLNQIFPDTQGEDNG